MTWRDTIRTATDAVRTHRLRSALTMLGILIGITAVILTVGLGRGAQADVRDQIDELGTNLLVVSPGSSTDSSGVRGGFGSTSTLTIADADALASDAAAPDVEAVAATATTSVALTNGDTNWTTTLTGTTPSWRGRALAAVTSGRFIDSSDEADAAAVVVLGPDTANELFPNQDPVGQTVTYNGTQLEVIGVLEELSSSEATANNDLAIVPFSTYSERLIGGTNRDAVNAIYVKATSSDALSAAYQESNALVVEPARHHVRGRRRRLLDRHTRVDHQCRDLGRPDDDGDARRDRGDLAPRRWYRRDEHHAGVRHRTDPRDRVAQGAWRATEVRSGGSSSSKRPCSGWPADSSAWRVACWAQQILPHFSDTRFVLALGPALLAIAMAVGIGVLFGVYPATRAARLAPIDALRNE